MSSQDPWFWTSEDLVTHLCDSQDLFKSAGCGPERLPDVAVLKERIIQTHANGRKLLSSLDLSTLADDLGTRHIAQKIGFLSVVELLQSRSNTYQQHEATKGVQALQVQDQQPLLASIDAVPSDHKKRKLSHYTDVTSAHGSAAATLAAYNDWLQGGGGGGDFDDLLRWDQKEEEEEEEEEDAISDTYVSPYEQMEDDALDDNDDDVEEISPGAAAHEDCWEQTATVRSDLTTEEIIEIINERVQFYAESWVPKKGCQKNVEGQYDTLKIWQDAEDSGQRIKMVRIYSNLVMDLGGRLDELGDAILQAPGKTAADVRKQCSNLEVTVHDLELAEWYLSIYKLEPVQESNGIWDEEMHSRDHSSDPVDTHQISQFHQSIDVIDLGSPSETSSGEDLEVDDVNQGKAKYVDGSPLSVARSPSIEPTVFPSIESQGPEDPNSQSGSNALMRPSTMPHIKKARGDTQTHDHPETTSLSDIRRWPWAQLVEARDRKRVVSKALFEMDAADREMIRERLRQVGKADLVREILACVSMLSRGETRLQGSLPRDMHKIMTSTRLFLCWWHCNNYTKKLPDDGQLHELIQCLESESQDPRVFYDYLGVLMTTTFSSFALTQDAAMPIAEIIEISDDEDTALKTSSSAASRFFQNPIQ